MRILFSCPNLHGGGAERVTSIIATELSRRGHKVSIVTDIFVEIAYELDENITIFPMFASKKQIGPIYKNLFAILNLRKAINAFKPDIAVGIMPRSYLHLLIASILKKMYIIASDHSGFSRKLWSKTDNAIRWHLYKYASATTILTEVDAKILGERIPGKIVIPNPLSFKCQDSLPEKKKYILAAGRLDVWYLKGFDILIESWGIIAKKHPDWKLIIAGEKTEKEEAIINDLLKRFGVENQVELTGFKKNLKSVMEDSSIFVLSSREEGFGLVLIEAMSQGCACISSDCQGRQREILSEGSGLILENLTAECLASKLELLINDEKYRMKLGEIAKETAKKYDVDIITDKWENLFTKIVEKDFY